MDIQPANWAIRIALAQQQGFFTEEDSTLCSEWMCCAVGERAKQSNLDPMDIVSKDEDTIQAYTDKFEIEDDNFLALLDEYQDCASAMDDLGMEFMTAVQNGHKCDHCTVAFEHTAVEVEHALRVYGEIGRQWDQLLELRSELVAADVLQGSAYNIAREAIVRDEVQQNTIRILRHRG